MAKKRGVFAGQHGDDQFDDTDLAGAFIGLPSNASTNGRSQNDHLFGDETDEVLNGGAKNDHISGGLGNDALLGGEGNDKLEGGPGNDLLIGVQGTTISPAAGESIPSCFVQDLARTPSPISASMTFST